MIKGCYETHHCVSWHARLNGIDGNHHATTLWSVDECSVLQRNDSKR